uniref:Uncharacterized protein n=1 Tax=Oryza nivara TaxID=4536 RepID=A0A0E0JAL4_ORYNI
MELLSSPSSHRHLPLCCLSSPDPTSHGPDLESSVEGEAGDREGTPEEEAGGGEGTAEGGEPTPRLSSIRSSSSIRATARRPEIHRRPTSTTATAADARRRRGGQRSIAARRSGHGTEARDPSSPRGGGEEWWSPRSLSARQLGGRLSEEEMRGADSGVSSSRRMARRRAWIPSIRLSAMGKWEREIGERGERKVKK